jgi:hypothetical protein
MPAYRARPGEIIITPLSYQSIGVPLKSWAQIGLTTSLAYPAADVGLFVPFTIPEPTTFTKLFWLNGSAAGDSWDIGLFLEDGTLIVAAGTQTGTGNSTVQVIDIADTTLARGRYYLGVTHSSTTANRAAGLFPAANICHGIGMFQDSSCAAPFSTNANPATFAAYAQAFIPAIGAQGYRAVGP